MPEDVAVLAADSHAAMEPAKWQWLSEHLRCPSCALAPLPLTTDGLACAGCGSVFGLRSRALDFLDLATADAYHVEETDNVSDHPFDGNALSIIQQVGSAGGMVLDCGSGLKTVSFAHVVQMEIVDYPLVDVLAVNQRLPFVDDCFDAVFSLDVLEHVDQPFVSAAEIARVLKPGGSLYIDLPFLQPEHGYPHHYFNATRQGLRQLFTGLEMISHHVPDSGHPIFLLHWALNEYRLGLPDDERAQFDAMTMVQLATRGPESLLTDPIVTNLNEDKRWILACTTQALLRKPARDSTVGSSAVVEARSLPGFPEAPKTPADPEVGVGVEVEVIEPEAVSVDQPSPEPNIPELPTPTSLASRLRRFQRFLGAVRSAWRTTR